MTTKLVCRLLDADGHLLGWTQHEAAIRGDGCLRANSLVQIPIERDGLPACVSLHWADLNVDVRVPAPVASVQAGMLVPIFQIDAPMIKVGEMPGPLPPVTVRSVAVGVPLGVMGARG